MEELRCLLDMPSLRVSYDAANNWLYSQWVGVHDAASIRAHAEHVCACLHKQPCAKILSDHSLLLGSWQGSASWVGRQFFDRLAAQGILYFAWVYSPYYTDRIAMERVLSLTPHPIAAIFDDVASAYDWLRRCPGGPAAPG